MARIGVDIDLARKTLENGGLVAIPTETVYGLAANAFDPEAVARVFEAKRRPFFDPLIVHCANLEDAAIFTRDLPEKALPLANKFWPGPLTLLLPKKNNIPDLVTAGMENVGVRVPDHILPLQLLNVINFPLVAPSANPFGYVSPTTAEHVNQQLGNKVDYILDGGKCNVGIESTIIGFDGDLITIYRLGGLEIDNIKDVVGEVNIRTQSTSNPGLPGMMKSHYAPLKRIVVGDIESLIPNYKQKRIGVIRFRSSGEQGKNEIVLSEGGNMREAAQNLFSALRKMDNSDIDIILAEEAPEEGLGLAINDRLRRAASDK